jgi:hypothetical protein
MATTHDPLRAQQKSKTNTGIPYELVVKAIFQEILNQEEAQTIDVQHNRVEQGVKTSHQIDVLWRFVRGGIQYTTIVQAKDWASKVSKEAILAFRGVLDDLPGQPRGLIVTRTGFQSGAKALAEKTGIDLYILRVQPKPKIMLEVLSWAKLEIKNLAMVATVYRPKVQLTVSSPEDNCASAPPVSASYSEIEFMNENNEVIGTMQDVLKPFFDEMRKTDTMSREFKKSYDELTYMRVAGSLVKWRVSSVTAIISMLAELQPPIPLLARGITTYILENLRDGQSQIRRVRQIASKN